MLWEETRALTNHGESDTWETISDLLWKRLISRPSLTNTGDLSDLYITLDLSGLVTRKSCYSSDFEMSSSQFKSSDANLLPTIHLILLWLLMIHFSLSLSSLNPEIWHRSRLPVPSEYSLNYLSWSKSSSHFNISKPPSSTIPQNIDILKYRM